MESEPNSYVIVSGGKITSSYSLKKLPLFNREGYNVWKEKMKFFIEGMDHGVWKVVNEDPFVLTHIVNTVVENKPKKY